MKTKPYSALTDLQKMFVLVTLLAVGKQYSERILPETDSYTVRITSPLTGHVTLTNNRRQAFITFVPDPTNVHFTVKFDRDVEVEVSQMLLNAYLKRFQRKDNA